MSEFRDLRKIELEGQGSKINEKRILCSEKGREKMTKEILLEIRRGIVSRGEEKHFSRQWKSYTPIKSKYSAREM